MTKRNEPINIATKLREKYAQEFIQPPTKKQEMWVNFKSILYTAIIGVSISILILGAAVIIPLVILVLTGAVIFIIVKGTLSYNSRQNNNKDEEDSIK